MSKNTFFNKYIIYENYSLVNNIFKKYTREVNFFMLNSEGKLRIRAYTAGGALPVKNALVKIAGAEEDNRLVAYTLMTDADGLTPEVILPTPGVEYSLSPNPEQSPYSVYDIEISAPGYYTKRIAGLTVFSGINSIQLVNMIPNSGGEMNDYPRGNINTVIPENNDL